MSIIWLDEPPYVMRNMCRDCYWDCRECDLTDDCPCESCYEEQQRQDCEDHR